MKEEQQSILDQMTVDLSMMLEQLYAFKEARQTELDAMDPKFREGEIGVKLQKAIDSLGNAEESIPQTIESLSAAREQM
jgi:hypothetical protein